MKRLLAVIGPGDLALCRLDLAAGYVMTALFGIAMVMIGSRLAGGGKGAGREPGSGGPRPVGKRGPVTERRLRRIAEIEDGECQIRAFQRFFKYTFRR